MTRRLPKYLLMLVCMIAPLVLADASMAAETSQPMRSGGMEIFFGVIPAEILLGHPDTHEERRMHGGAPSRKGQHHLIVSVFDGTTRERIANAAVTARVGEIGLSVQEKKLEPMQFAGTATYGNYFTMAAPGPYRVELEIRKSGDRQQVKTSFVYSHPRR